MTAARQIRRRAHLWTPFPHELSHTKELKLSPETLAAIYSGTVTSWSDPKIAADNPGVTLPKEPIAVVHRSDASGTTALFTGYLSGASADWKAKVGEGTTVKWPAGAGASESAGVMKAIGETKGSIGYLEQSYALGQASPPALASIKNAAGDFVRPSALSVAAAADSFAARMPADLRASIVDPQGSKEAYPISGMLYVLLPGEMKDVTKAEALTDFLYWGLTRGGMQDEQHHYVPLPGALQQRAAALLAKVQVNGRAAFEPPHAG